MTSTLTDYQRDILARTALGEAAGEGLTGMEQVIHVIQNRANSGQYSNDPAAVALQPSQFSAWNSSNNGGNNLVNTAPGSRSYQRALDAVDAVYGGDSPDLTGGALFYHAAGTNAPWANSVNRYGTIRVGNHIFYPSHPVPPGTVDGTSNVGTDLDVKQRAPTPADRPSFYAKNSSGSPDERQRNWLPTPVPLPFDIQRPSSALPMIPGDTPGALGVTSSLNWQNNDIGGTTVPRRVLSHNDMLSAQGSAAGVSGMGSQSDPNFAALMAPKLPAIPSTFPARPTVPAPNTSAPASTFPARPSVPSPNNALPSIPGPIGSAFTGGWGSSALTPTPGVQKAITPGIDMAGSVALPADYRPPAANLPYTLPSVPSLPTPPPVAIPRAVTAPKPATMSPALAALRLLAASQPAPSAPIPATMSAGLAALRGVPAIPAPLNRNTGQSTATVTGSNTGQKYAVGQTVKGTNGYTYQAQADGSFKKVG